MPSLSIGGFTNGVRVVDMAKGYSTLANYGVYNDRTCITQIIHEHDGDLTKDLPPAAKQVYRDDSAFMLTDILKGTMTSPYGTGRGLELDNGMPAAGKTGTTNSSKDTWVLRLHPLLYHGCVGGIRYPPQDARHIRKHICRKNLEKYYEPDT